VEQFEGVTSHARISMESLELNGVAMTWPDNAHPAEIGENLADMEFPAQVLSGVDRAQNESGLFSSESVLNILRFFRDFARKKWPLRATRGRSFKPDFAVPHSANLRLSLSGPWGQNKKGQSLKPCPCLWSLATALRSLASVALSSEPAWHNIA
jgi:hypothetical protein